MFSSSILSALLSTSLAVPPGSGATYHYVRSNLDGSNSELISVHQVDQDTIEVYKRRLPCHNAALVRGELDLSTGNAETIIGGALLPDGEVREFAFFERDPETGYATMRVELPDQTLTLNTEIPAEHWTLFDFDLSELTVSSRARVQSGEAFELGFGLVWADPSVEAPLSYLGAVTATPIEATTHLDHETILYDLSGEAFGSDQGQLWLEAEHGYVVDAQFPIPSHPGYQDFRLKLLDAENLSDREWDAVLRAQFDNCES